MGVTRRSKAKPTCNIDMRGRNGAFRPWPPVFARFASHRFGTKVGHKWVANAKNGTMQDANLCFLDLMLTLLPPKIPK